MLFSVVAVPNFITSYKSKYWVAKIPWRRERLPTPVFFSGEFHGLVHGVARSWTRLSDFRIHLISHNTLVNMVYTWKKIGI